MGTLLRILHLEDDPVDSELVQELLGEAGLAVEIHRVDTLAEFQAALARGGFRLILSDYTLPGTDTLAALRWARQKSPQVPFIFFSGTMGEETAIDTLKLGATDYVLKQRPQRLVPAVRRAVQEADEQDRLRRAEARLGLKEKELRELGRLLDLANAVVLDPQDRITYWSSGCQQLYGFTAEQAIGQVSHELLKTRFPEPLDRIKAILRENGRWEGPLVHRRADGGEVIVASIWVLHRDESGQPLAILEVNNDITEQRRAEDERTRAREALRASEAQVRLLAAALEAAASAISLSKTDPEGTLVWVNPAFTELTGYSAREAIGQSHRILSSGQQDEAFYRNLWGTIQRGEVWRGELVNRRKDGTLYHEEMGITPLRDEQGKVTHYVAIKQDITARKRTEAAMRESEARFRALVMASAQTVWVARPTGEISEDSPSWRAFTGQNLEQYLGYGWLEALHPEDRQPVVEAWRTAVESCRSYETEYRVRNAVGEYRQTIARAVPIINEDGSVREWVGMNTDVTEQRQAQQALRESHQFQQTVLNALTAHLAVLDSDGRVVAVNQAWQQFAQANGNPPRDRVAVGANYLEVCRRAAQSGDTDAERALNGIGGVLEGSLPQFACEYPCHAPTVDRWYSMQVVPLPQGRGAVVSHTDITERKQAELELRQARDAAQQRAREAEERERILSAMMEHIPMGITIADAPDVNIRAVSRYGRELTGQDRRQIEGIPVELHAQRWRIFRKDGVTSATNEELPLTRAVQKGEVVREEEFVLQRADGSKVPILCTAAPIRDAQGHVTGGVIGWQDISDRKRAEAALRESEDRLNLAADATGLGTFDYHPETGELIWSAHAKRHFGLRPDAPVDYSVFLRGLHPEDRDRVEAVVQNALRPESGGRYKIEYRTLGIEDGIERWLSATGQVYFDDAGRAVRFIGTTLDITAQKWTQAELAEARRRLESALIAGEVGTFEWDVVGERVGGDSNFARMFGVALDEHGAAPLADYVAVMHPDDQERVRRRIALTVETGVDYEIEYRVVSGGRTRWLLVRAKPELDASGRAVRAAGVCLDVTQRKQAEEALRQSEERHRLAAEELQAVMDATPAGICVAHDPQCRVITGNQVAHELFDVPTGENISATPSGSDVSPYFRIYRDGREVRGTEQPMQVSAATGAIIRDVELVAVRRDGTQRVFLLTAAPLRLPDGTIWGAVAAFTDITERKQAEELLAANLDAMTRLQKLGTLYVQEGNLVPVLGEMVEAAIAISGADFGNSQLFDEASGNLRIVAQRGFPQWWIDFWNTVTKGRGVCGTVLARGERVIVEDVATSPIFAGTEAMKMQVKAGVRAVVSTPLISRSGRLVGVVSTHFRRPHRPDDRALRLLDLLARQAADLIEHGQAEEALRQTNSELQTANEQLQVVNEEFQSTGEELTLQNARLAEAQSLLESERQRYAALFQSAPDGYVVTNASSVILEVNRTAAAMLGTVQGPLAGARLCQYVLPEQRERFLETLSQLAREGGSASLDLRMGPSVHGPWIDVAIRASARASGDGPPSHIRWMLRDVSDLKAAEEELKQAKRSAEQATAAAEEASRAKDQFLAVLSHELRTPLTPVVAAVSMLQKQWRCDRASGEALEMIRRNVEMEARLIDDLLDVTRITRGKIELDRRAIPLCEVIRRAVEVCKPDIEARRLHFGLDIGPCAPYIIFADAARLQQVFWNLLKNAIKFTPHGGCVGIRCWPDDHSVIAEVVDSGEGIDPAVLPSIFNPFEQGGTRVTRQFGGLGLGLTITKGLVEMHGGVISAHSQGKGQGASFRVRLPLHVGAETPLRPEQGEREGDTGTPVAAEPRSLRILLVEDHGDTARAMQRLLMADGHEVETAGDVATALEVAARGEFDLLISDLGLPDASGLDLMRELRQRGSAMPSIALSGYGQEEDIRRSKEAGFAAHLTKPTSPERLAEAIAAITGQGATHEPPRD